MYFVYIIRCADKSLYTGVTTNVERRFAEHRAGTGAAYTRAHTPKKIVYIETCTDRSAAQKREYEIKQLTKEQKEGLVLHATKI